MLELNDGQTIKLQKEMGEALAKLGFAIDTRPFRLHLTLGRVKFKTSLQIPKFVIRTSAFSIQAIDLMQSELTPGGPIYNLVKAYKLKS